MEVTGTFGGLHDILKLIISALFALLYRPIDRSRRYDLGYEIDSAREFPHSLDPQQPLVLCETGHSGVEAWPWRARLP